MGYGSLILCVVSLTYYRSDQSSCPLCLEWFLPLARQHDCILEYILPTKPKRASCVWTTNKITGNGFIWGNSL
ncbi:MAG: hypothetical protein EWV61_20500 [Microcystis aeruginosa Ma_AC_P_19900807_S300]|nr:MAG: hypothetical protein EWV61_20500 [Microcystis aeruginosa Ma_AC_P_19900807_S300]